MKYLKTLVMVLLVVGMARPAWGWWIFGRARGEVEIQRLQVNNISVDEAGEGIALPRDLLAEGRLVVSGRARAGRATIGAVEVSTDDQATWEMAEMAADGTFHYGWRPEPDVTYTVLVRATTTTGQTNRVEETRLRISLTDQDLRGMVLEALQRLVAAYQDENAAAFMANVSRNFTADPSILDSAIRRDFSFFSDIRISFVLSGLAIDYRGRIMAVINFNRSLTSVRSGEQFSDRGLTEFTFVQEEETVKVYSMKQPLIFGLSAAEDVATGEVSQDPGTEFITVGDAGEVDKKSYQQIVSGETSESGDFLLGSEEGWIFAGGGEVTGDFNQADIFVWLDCTHAIMIFNHVHADGAAELGFGNIDQVTEAPETGYHNPEVHLEGEEGMLYALRTRGGNYAVIQIVSVSPTGVRIRYKYQPDGSRFF